jgi:hypothetical protein
VLRNKQNFIIESLTNTLYLLSHLWHLQYLQLQKELQGVSASSIFLKRSAREKCSAANNAASGEVLYPCLEVYWMWNYHTDGTTRNTTVFRH